MIEVSQEFYESMKEKGLSNPEILSCWYLIQNKSVYEIAMLTRKGLTTVKVHWQSIREKLKVKNRAELINIRDQFFPKKELTLTLVVDDLYLLKDEMNKVKKEVVELQIEVEKIKKEKPQFSLPIGAKN